jgi:predicted Zn finger-like uncharacterized protein
LAGRRDSQIEALMKIICDSCGTKYSISDDKVRGKVFKIRCKKCSHIIVVRGGETQEEAAAPAPADGGWHIVVEGEQVGPISEADVRARVERGEIRGDTYIWKEGFADWLKLSTVPEFADIAPPDSGSVNIGDVFTADAVQPSNGTERSSRRRSGASRPLFGGGGDGGGEADVFAAPAAASPSSGGDLFGSAGVHSTASSEPRWPSSGGGASMAGHDGGRVDNLTGQRHENSVLFSLSNLQSLAMPSAKPSSSPSSFGAPSAPTTEGSGLIDIRAMAASTRGAPADGPTTTMDDDLPAFGAFSPAAPVLLPMPSSSGPPWWVYLVIVGMLGLVGVIGFAAWRVISPKQVVVVKEVQVPVPAPEPAKTAAKTPGADDKKPSTIAEKDLPPREGGKEAQEGKEAKEGKEKGRRSSRSGSKEAKKPTSSGDDKKPAAPIAAIAEPPKPAKGSLDALLNDAAPRASNRPKAGDDDKRGGGGGGESAGPLAKNALVAGLNSVRPKVQACYNQFKVPGTAMVDVNIGKSGKVTSATVTGKFAGTPTGTCVEAAVKTASFPPSDGFRTPYPFQLK